MTLRSKFVRFFLTASLFLTQLQLVGFAGTGIHLEVTFDTITGTLQGYVLDPAGVGIPGVSVRVINLDTNNQRAVQTDREGLYKFTLLPMGPYRIEASKEGFNIGPMEKTSIQVRLNQTVIWAPPVRMVPVGPAPAVVAATVTPPPAPQTPTATKDEYSGQLVNETDATRRANADERMVSLVPLANIRSFDDLALLAAGVAPPPQVKGVAGPGIGAGIGTAGQFSVNGQRARSNNFTVDGSDNNDEDVGVRRQGFVALVPQSIESVKEIQIVTHLWDAEQGRSLGSQVNAVSKSGTNQIHGTLYDFFNHDALNARNFFDYSADGVPARTLTGTFIRQYNSGKPEIVGQLPVTINGVPVVQPNPSQGKDQFQRNQGGATLGFPVFRDKTFFFGSFERQDIHSRQETHFDVPTVAQRGFLNFGATGFKTKDTAGNLRTFFPTYSAGDSIFSLFPFPNNPVGPYGENTYTQVLPADAHATIYSLKFDHTFHMFGPEVVHSLTGRYNFTDDRRQVPVVGGALFSGVMPKVRTQNLSLFLNSQLSPSKANQIRLSYGRTALSFDEIRDPYLRKSELLPNEPYLLNATRLVNLSIPSRNPTAPPPTAINYVSAPSGSESNLGALGQLIVAPFSPVGLDVYLFPQARANNTIQFADTYTWFRAEQTYKFGADIRRTQLNSYLNRNFRPQAVFSGTPDLTKNYPQAPLQNLSLDGPTPGFFSGADLASRGIQTDIFQSLAIGTPDSTLGLRFWQLNFFANDNWRARRGLTLDYGLRYELNTVPRDVNSRIEQTFGLDQLPATDPSMVLLQPFTNPAKPISSDMLLRSYNTTLSALRQTLGDRDSIFAADRNNFGGHFGFAWDPFANDKEKAGKTVIRGGAGVYYDLTLGSVVSQSRNVFPNFLPFNVDASTFAYARQRFFELGENGNDVDNAALFNPDFVKIQLLGQSDFVGLVRGQSLNAIRLPPGTLPQVLGLLFDPSVINPTINGQRLTSGGGLAYTLPDKGLRSPYALQYNLQIERELFNDFLVNLAYVGTRGIKLTRFRTPNGGPNSIAVPIDPLGLSLPNYNPSNPDTFPLLAIALPPLSDLDNKKFSRPNPALGAYTIFDSSAASVYHSLQLTVTKRFARGHQLTAAYTWSHAIDDVSDVFDVGGAYVLPQDDRALGAERASANFDVRHRLAISTIGNAPFLGRFNDAKGAKGLILGGWQYASFTTYQTGQPFTVNSSYDINLDGNLTDRLNTLNGLTIVDDRRVKLQLNAPATSLLAKVGYNGALGRNTFRASGIAKTDFTIIKNIRLAEGRIIVFRAEAFNIWNRTHFGIPVRVLEAPSFGQSVDTLINPRQIQFALKYVF